MRNKINWFVILLLMSKFSALAIAQSIQWEKVAELTTPKGNPHIGVAGAFVGVHNNVLIVAGGANFAKKMPWEGGKKVYHKDIFIFRRQQSKLQQIAVQQMPHAIAYGMSIATPNGIFCAGGEDENGNKKECFLLKYNTDNHYIEIVAMPNLPFALANATIALYNQKIYVAGGESDGKTVGFFIFLDLKNLQKGWQSLPPIPMKVSHAVGGFLEEKNMFCIASGRRKNVEAISTFYNDCYGYDFRQNQWKKLAPLPTKSGLSAATGIALNKHQLIVISGDEGKTFNQVEQLIIESNKATNDADKQRLTQQKSKLLMNHSGFSNKVWLYDSRNNKWKQLNDIPYQGQVTTTAVKWGNEIYIPSGEIRAGVRTPAIWRGKFVN